MPVWQTKIGITHREIDAPTGDYRLVVAMAAALADARLPCVVKIWCADLLPEYGPYTYHVLSDECGNLVVKHAT